MVTSPPLEAFAVVLHDAALPPPEKLSVLFQAICGMTKADAMTRAARASGIVAERLSADHAQRLQFALGNLKHPAAVVPQNALPEAVRGRRVQLLSVSPEAFGVRWQVTGQPELYPWSDLLVMSAAVVHLQREEQLIEAVDTPAPARYRSSLTFETRKRDVSHDVAMASITLGRSRERLETLRMRASELDYATMFGDQLSGSALQSFCTLLARIGMYATAAHVTEETLELMAAAQTSPKLPTSPRFDREEDFDRYQRWLVARELTRLTP
jgi:hypothetical protein